MATAEPTERPREQVGGRRLMVAMVRMLLGYVFCLFLPAGTWSWPRGWIYFAVIVASSMVALCYLNRVNPRVIAARLTRHQGTKAWDRWLLIVFFTAVLAIPIVSALDDGRYHWSGLPWWASAIGYIVLLAGLAGVTWAESVNPFFEVTVRIQSDRGQRVVDSGPYARIRHPGYAFGSLYMLGTPPALGSWWGLVPAAVVVLLLILRTSWEDQTLQAELPGYREYAQRVRHRLLPGVW
ncbi:MAG: isoprenylcysteine carboxylmethyltransferase family protein [Isosphaeraceae bacterium]